MEMRLPAGGRDKQSKLKNSLPYSRQPEEGLPYRIVADDFFHSRIWIEPAPDVEVLDVLCVGPRFFVRDERRHKGHRHCKPSAIGKRIGEKIVLRRRENLADSGHHVEVEKAVAVRLRATKLPWKTAVGGDLLRHQDCLESRSRKFT